ncbi:proline-rich protein 13-like isoform X1 [Chroicocephalus ridibundus]|uniref:proline-rich protein 13-like isoform X1 n=1 Tax=Chroicocephalus ridibundus TaxID=1192867 RepID=UPI002FDCCFE4
MVTVMVQGVVWCQPLPTTPLLVWAEPWYLAGACHPRRDVLRTAIRGAAGSSAFRECCQHLLCWELFCRSAWLPRRMWNPNPGMPGGVPPPQLQICPPAPPGYPGPGTPAGPYPGYPAVPPGAPGTYPPAPPGGYPCGPPPPGPYPQGQHPHGHPPQGHHAHGHPYPGPPGMPGCPPGHHQKHHKKHKKKHSKHHGGKHSGSSSSSSSSSDSD